MINVITVSDNIKIISTLSKIFDNNTEINASFSQINDVTKNLFENDKINLVIFTELISEKENNDLLQLISTKKIPSLFILNANQSSNLPSETIYNNFRKLFNFYVFNMSVFKFFNFLVNFQKITYAIIRFIKIKVF